MIHGLCVTCLKGTMFFSGAFYRCDFCGYQQPTLLASSQNVEVISKWAAALLEKPIDPFAVRPTKLFAIDEGHLILQTPKSYQQLADRAVYAAPVVKQLSLFDTTDHILFGGG